MRCRHPEPARLTAVRQVTAGRLASGHLKWFVLAFLWTDKPIKKFLNPIILEAEPKGIF